MDIKDAKTKYKQQQYAAQQRGIPFLLTLEEWCNIWEQSGKWALRGKGKGKYVMSRYKDVGAYEVNNVFIQLNESNVRDAQTGRSRPDSVKANISKALIGNTHGTGLKGRPQTLEHRTNRSKALKGMVHPTMQCVHCSIIATAGNIKRWHLDKCKFLNR
jgi:hypothetical protein